uniref:Uncharacterized protein n=1 Tax=Leersia perrieri TaxID=77586 RepID=A0A0D9WQB4_9ORYZ
MGKMFFSGDPTTRKRVDLGGRSNKEKDRQVLIERGRNGGEAIRRGTGRCLSSRRGRSGGGWGLRLQNSSATKIQKLEEQSGLFLHFIQRLNSFIS